MNAAEVIAVLLSLITILLGVIAYFLARLIGKVDSVALDMHKFGQAFVLFRQRVCIALGWPVDDDDNLTPQTTTQ